MRAFGGSGDLAKRTVASCAALAVAVALSGCGPVISVASTAYNGVEALVTVGKLAADGDSGYQPDTGDAPE